MKIDLTLLEEIGSKKEINTKIGFENLSFRNQEIQIPELLPLNLDIYKTENAYVFTGKLKGKLILECSRCLEPFPYDFEIEINKEIESKEINDLQRFDLDEMLKKDIFLAIPIKPLCSDNCKGLCDQCGKNLNKGKCNCEEDIIDPRLAELKNLYNEEENN
ncbi:MAG: YceD family protein [Halanaerobiaceae bacterium]